MFCFNAEGTEGRGEELQTRRSGDRRSRGAGGAGGSRATARFGEAWLKPEKRRQAAALQKNQDANRETGVPRSRQDTGAPTEGRTKKLTGWREMDNLWGRI